MFKSHRDRNPTEDYSSNYSSEEDNGYEIDDETELVRNDSNLENAIFIENFIETEPLVTKTVVYVEKSTFTQSIFNSVNILMGIGVLSLPYAFNITGFALGLFLLFLFSVMTHHTGKLLQKCLDYDGYRSVRSSGSKFVVNNYGDLGELAFGQTGRAFISVIFFFELLAATIALVILSADSITAIFPGLRIEYVKIIIVSLVFPATIPKSMSFASYGSLVGIIALLNLIGILLFDGLATTVSPGSIFVPADVSFGPVDWFRVPFSFGLIMAGFAGHSVFPNIYRDMKEPEKYPKLLNYSYLIIGLLYALIASVGYLMFGSGVREEVTK
jgi:vesicular inhibitory amino acid transporter